MRRIIIYLIFFVSLFSCNDDDQPQYTQEWTLDLGKHLGIKFDGENGKSFQPVLLSNGLVLVNTHASAGKFLVEIDPNKGSIESSTPVSSGDIFNLKKKANGEILVSNYSLETDEYSFGIYNEETHQINYFSSISGQMFNNPFEGVLPFDNGIYTNDSNVSPSNTGEVYIAKWDFEGNQIWKKIIDPLAEEKVAYLSRLTRLSSDHLLFATVKDFDTINEKWRIGKISTEGEIIWLKEINNLKLIRLFENSVGDIFVFRYQIVVKCNSDGQVQWESSLSNYNPDYIHDFYPTNDDGLLVQIGNDETKLVKLNSNGKITWSVNYWEVSGGNATNLSFAELPNGDFIATSMKGFITKYKLTGN